MTKIMTSVINLLRNLTNERGQVDMDALFATDIRVANRTLSALARRGAITLEWTEFITTGSWTGTHYATRRRVAITSITVL